MAKRTVYVWDNPQTIKLCEKTAGTWVAKGDHRGEVIVARATDEGAALQQWVLLARAVDGNETPHRRIRTPWYSN